MCEVSLNKSFWWKGGESTTKIIPFVGSSTPPNSKHILLLIQKYLAHRSINNSDIKNSSKNKIHKKYISTKKKKKKKKIY